MKIVVLGYIVRGPLGGLAWHHFQYVLGLKTLGHEVLFIEDSDDFPGCYNPSKFTVTDDPSYGLKFIQELFKTYDCNNNWAYFDAHTNSWFGKSKMQVYSFCSTSDLVLNISGVNPVREWWEKIQRRGYVDTDPGFTQVRHLSESHAFELANAHTHHFTFAENIGKQNCTIPDDGFNWKPTRQPVFLDAWQMATEHPNDKWSTVMQWDSYKEREYNGQIFGMKSRSFQVFEKLPQLLPGERFQLALGNASNTIKNDLAYKGWDLISSLIPTETPWTYQQYIAQSKGEWSISKSGYVDSNSGWFSERSTCYLASGKPVIVQDTGFSEIFETGKGIFAFSNPEQVVEAVLVINKDYSAQSKMARSFIQENFISWKVLSSLLTNHS